MPHKAPFPLTDQNLNLPSLLYVVLTDPEDAHPTLRRGSHPPSPSQRTSTSILQEPSNP